MLSSFSTSFSFGRRITASSGTIILDANLTKTGISTVANTVTQFGTSVNCYQFAGSTTSHISFIGSTNMAMGTGDYTVEWFQYETDSNSFPRPWWYGTGPSLGMSLEGSVPYVWPGATNMGNLGTYKNNWVHFALVRISSKIYFYKNGTLLSTAGGVSNVTNITDTTSRFYIGSKAAGGLASEQFGGLITNFRVCKGLGVYTGAFTSPSSPLQSTQSSGTNISAITTQCTVLLTP